MDSLFCFDTYCNKAKLLQKAEKSRQLCRCIHFKKYRDPLLLQSSLVITKPPVTHPTNDTLIEFLIQWNFVLLLFQNKPS